MLPVMGYKKTIMLISFCIGLIPLSSCSLFCGSHNLCSKYVVDLDSSITTIKFTPNKDHRCDIKQIENDCEDNFGYLLNYDNIDPKNKIFVIQNIAIDGSDIFQCIRFICWLNETDALIRTKLLSQWFSIQRMNGLLPPKHQLLGAINNVLLEFDEAERMLRMNEIEQAYGTSISDIQWPWNKSKYYNDIPQLLQEHSCGVLDLVDKSEPMSMKVFSSNKTKALTAIEQSESRNLFLYIQPNGERIAYGCASIPVAFATRLIKSSLNKQSTDDSRPQ